MIRIRMAVFGVVFACAVGAHAQGNAAAENEARALKGDTKGAAANNPQCKLFSKAEAGQYIGATVNTMENAGMGLGCQWAVGGGNGAMMVSVVPARYHEPPRLGKGFKKLPDVGAEGFVVPQLGGWEAGSIVGTQAIEVSLDGKGASEAKTIDLLREAIKRHTAAASR